MSHRDARDDKTWVVYELTHAGENAASEGLLEKRLKDLFESKVDVFVPYRSYRCDDSSKRCVTHVMEGYSFVSSGLEDSIYFHVLGRTPYLKSVLSSPGTSKRGPVLHTVSDRSVRSLRDQLNSMFEIQIGMTVDISQGICKGLSGKVLWVGEDVAHVLITLRTLNTIRTLSRHAIVPSQEGV